MIRRVPEARPFVWLMLATVWVLSSCGDDGPGSSAPSRFAIRVLANGAAADSGTFGSCQTTGQVNFTEQGASQWTGLASGTFDVSLAGRRLEAAIGGRFDTSGTFSTIYTLQILPDDSVRLEFSPITLDPRIPARELRPLSGILRADFTIGGMWSCIEIPDSLGIVPIAGAWSLLPS